MPPIITREQRDAIYEVVLDHLSGIGDVWVAVQGEDFEIAARFGREFAEDLRLLQDLGWGESDREAFELTMPPDDLAPILYRLKDDAAQGLDEMKRPRHEEKIATRYRIAAVACGRVLGELDGRTG